MNNSVESWKSHPDIVGIEVSSFGRVRTLDKVTSSEKYTRFIKGHVLKQYDDGRGYLQVCIPFGGKWARKKVHRLVAQTFIANPNSLPMVNHKDCNRKNNNVDNLEFCDGSYNQQYRQEYGASQRQPVFAVNLKTLEVSSFQSQAEASRALGVSQGNINGVIKGSRKHTHSFWFVNDDGHAVDIVKSKLHDIGKTGLNIKHLATSNMH